MNAVLEAKLARIKNYRTSYELCMSDDDGTTYLVCYSEGRSRRDVWNILCKGAHHITKIIGHNPECVWAKRASDGCKVGKWRIYWSGRTQRDAYLEGERAYIGDV